MFSQHHHIRETIKAVLKRSHGIHFTANKLIYQTSAQFQFQIRNAAFIPMDESQGLSAVDVGKIDRAAHANSEGR